MLQPFNFSGVTPLQARGRTFHYTSSDAALSGADPRILVAADGQTIGELVPGDSVRLPVSAARWEVRPMFASPLLTGRVMIGDGSVQTSRVYGTVEVIEQGAALTRQGRQFFQYFDRTAAAGLYSAMSVCATGADLLIRSVLVTGAAAGVARLWVCDGQASAPIAAYSPINKYLGQADGTLHQYEANDSTTNAAAVPVVAGYSNFRDLGPTRFTTTWSGQVFSLPLIVPRGKALMIVAQTAAAQLIAQFNVEEIAGASTDGGVPSGAVGP